MENADYRRVTKVKGFGNGIGGVELECSNEEARERLYQLEDMIDDNVLRFMPCRIGTTMWFFSPIDHCTYSSKLVRVEMFEFNTVLAFENGQKISTANIGRRVFFTQNDAVSALKEWSWNND